MLELSAPTITRTRIRHALSLSLLTQRPFRLRGGYACILGDGAFQAVISDWEDVLHNLEAGSLSGEGDDLLFYPALVRHGNYSFSTNPYSPSAEIVLLLLPVLSSLKYRTSLMIGGVTHAGASYSSDFVRDTLMGLLERMGFYASFSLKRFGFYGSGGGMVESRIYPAERKKAGGFGVPAYSEISGARVYISKIDAGIALAQRELLSEALCIPSEKIGIIEVRDSDGRGNFIQVYFKHKAGPPAVGGALSGPEDMVISDIFDMYDWRGEAVYSEDSVKEAVTGFAGSCAGLTTTGRLPGFILEELAPYALLTGSELPGADETMRMLEAFF